MNISEIFYSIQGEGPLLGSPSLFVRAYGCNLDCSWCDTPYTWDTTRYPKVEECHETPVEEIVETFRESLAHTMVVTGGEPLIQRDAMVDLVHGVWANGSGRVQFETNGTQHPLGSAVHGLVTYVVSPKLVSSGVTRNRYNLDRLAEYKARDSHLKWVVTPDIRDMAEILSVVDELSWPSDRVWLMPEGRTYAEQAMSSLRVAELALAHGFNYSPRAHIELWGDTRGT